MAKKFATLDLETDPFKFGRTPAPFCGGFYDGHDYVSYWGEKTIEYLVEDLKEFDGIVYAHNGGKFDWHYFLEYVDYGSIKIINGRIAQMQLGKATLRDSYLILPVPLGAYQKDAIDYNLMEKEHRENYKLEILNYLRGDCFYLYELVEAFISNYGNGLTLAGRALKDLEERCGKIHRCGRDHDARFRPFYFGGRVEVFQRGIIEGNLKFYDIKSAYPAAMVKQHPHGAEYDVIDYIPDPINPCAFYHVSGTAHGCFAIKRDNKTDFPHEYGEFYTTGYEYKAAIELGLFELDKVHAVYVAAHTRDFSPYVNAHYEEKQRAENNNDAIGRLFAKIFLNSGYGKLAADPAKYCDYLLVAAGELYEGWDLENDDLGGKWLLSAPIDTDSAAAVYYDVATAASITGYVRAFMLRALNSVTLPVYCDTDSILCANGDALKLGDELGDWDLEAEVNLAAVAGKKLYAVRKKDGHYKTASKGVRARPSEIFRAAAGEVVKIDNIAPSFSVSRVGEKVNGLPSANWQSRRIRAT